CAADGFGGLRWLSREMNRLVRIDPTFVGEVYRVAFAHREYSAATTATLAGRILPLVSTRRQDYGMALYELAEVFPEFLAHAPVPALRALIVILEAYVAEQHAIPSEQTVEDVFDFRGRDARILRH